MATAPKEEHPLLTEEPRRVMAFRMARRSVSAAAAATAAYTSASKGRGRRRAKMAVARLGGDRRLRLRGRLVMLGAVLLRRLRLRWLAVQYRRLRSYYARLLRDMIEAAADAEAVRSRVIMDSYYAVLPVATTSF